MYKLSLYTFLHFIIGLACYLPLQGQVKNDSPLRLSDIMKGEEFIGYSPTRMAWTEDGKSIYFQWNPESKALRDLYKVGANGGAPTLLSAEEERANPRQGGSYTPDRAYKAFAAGGDIYWMDIKNNAVKAITQTVDRESSPMMSQDGKHVIYRSGNNLFAWSVKEGSTKQLSNFKSGNEPREGGGSKQKQWLEKEQLENFDILRERKAVREMREERNEKRGLNYPSPVYLGKQRIMDFTLSPDMQYITCQLYTAPKDKNTHVPDFVTESGYINDLNARSKVGDEQGKYGLGIYDLKRDTFYTVSTEEIEGIYDKPEYLKEYHSGKEEDAYHATYENPREVVIHSPIYSEEGLAVVDIKAMDNKDRWIMLLDLPTGKLKLLDRQQDEAWIGGPGISGWNMVAGNMGWIDGHTMWFQSEESGYSHLYKLNIISDDIEPLTEGEFEVLEVYLSHDRSTFYLLTNEKSPHENHIYRMPVSGGKRVQLTTKPGGYRMQISPDEKKFALLYSTSNKPWELYVMENKEGAGMRQLTISTKPAFEKYSWRKPDIINFTARDGAKVPARLYLPDNPNKNTPAVIFVHGAGYLQNVHRWWSSYYREYMFHNMLADNGFAVLDIDYRGSKGYGRDWRTGIYRNMGGKDLTDQVDGAKYLVEGLGINPNNIGIYGGSYGGFITLMAMFKEGDTFKCGAALRSVTDWAHYNHPYTSNILNTPQEDELAYKRSSPIYHADGLKGRLVILHGMVDTNVQFQDVVRLSQRLIELGKTNWDLAVFPMEAHGFQEASSWTDEYRRIFEMFQKELK